MQLIVFGTCLLFEACNVNVEGLGSPREAEICFVVCFVFGEGVVNNVGATVIFSAIPNRESICEDQLLDNSSESESAQLLCAAFAELLPDVCTCFALRRGLPQLVCIRSYAEGGRGQRGLKRLKCAKRCSFAGAAWRIRFREIHRLGRDGSWGRLG